MNIKDVFKGYGLMPKINSLNYEKKLAGQIYKPIVTNASQVICVRTFISEDISNS